MRIDPVYSGRKAGLNFDVNARTSKCGTKSGTKIAVPRLPPGGTLGPARGPPFVHVNASGPKCAAKPKPTQLIALTSLAPVQYCNYCVNDGLASDVTWLCHWIETILQQISLQAGKSKSTYIRLVFHSFND